MRHVTLDLVAQFSVCLRTDGVKSDDLISPNFVSPTGGGQDGIVRNDVHGKTKLNPDGTVVLWPSHGACSQQQSNKTNKCLSC